MKLEQESVLTFETKESMQDDTHLSMQLSVLHRTQTYSLRSSVAIVEWSLLNTGMYSVTGSSNLSFAFTLKFKIWRSLTQAINKYQ